MWVPGKSAWLVCTALQSRCSPTAQYHTLTPLTLCITGKQQYCYLYFGRKWTRLGDLWPRPELCSEFIHPSQSEGKVYWADDWWACVCVCVCVCAHACMSVVLIYIFYMIVCTVMFVDVGNNRNVLENLSLSFVSSPMIFDLYIYTIILYYAHIAMLCRCTRRWLRTHTRKLVRQTLWPSLERRISTSLQWETGYCSTSLEQLTEGRCGCVDG